MFSFSKLALVFALGTAALTSATAFVKEPAFEDKLVEARCENGCSSEGGAQVSLTVQIQTLLDTVTPICAELNTYTDATITVDIVENKIAEISAAVVVAINGVKALTGASAGVILGVNVDVSVCVKLFAKVFILIFETLGFLLTICVKISVKHLLVAVGKLVIELLVVILALLQTVGGVIGLVLLLLRTLLVVVFSIVVKLGLQAELSACLGISVN